jgi:hypothetical protein
MDPIGISLAGFAYPSIAVLNVLAIGGVAFCSVCAKLAELA